MARSSMAGRRGPQWRAGNPWAARGAAPASPCPSRRGLEPRPRVPIRGGALTQVSVPDQTAFPGPPRCYSPALPRRFCPWATAAAARSPAALRGSPPTAAARRGTDPPPIPRGEPPRGVRESGGCREHTSAPARDSRKQSGAVRLALHPADGRTTLHLPSACLLFHQEMSLLVQGFEIPYGSRLLSKSDGFSYSFPTIPLYTKS